MAHTIQEIVIARMICRGKTTMINITTGTSLRLVVVTFRARVVFRSYWRFEYLCGSHLQSRIFRRLTLTMTAAQVVETSVTLNSLPEDYSHQEGHNNQTVSISGLRPFANTDCMIQMMTLRATTIITMTITVMTMMMIMMMLMTTMMMTMMMTMVMMVFSMMVVVTQG